MKNGGDDDWSSRVLVFVPGKFGNKIVLIQARRKPNPKLWNFPGGKKNPGETPLDTALRELKEETGLRVKPENMIPLGIVPRTGHSVHLFGTYIEDTSTLLATGSDGETVGTFDESLFLLMKNFVPENKGFYEIARKTLEVRGTKPRRRKVPRVA